MLKDIGNLSMKRNWKEAIVFYVAYLLLLLLICFLTGVIIGVFNPNYSVETVEKIATFIIAAYCIILYFAVYFKKKMSSFPFIILGLVAAIISFLLGEILALIIVAFLTTRDDESGSNIDAVDSDIN